VDDLQPFRMFLFLVALFNPHFFSILIVTNPFTCSFHINCYAFFS
jgi:hypothetical protein